MIYIKNITREKQLILLLSNPYLDNSEDIRLMNKLLQKNLDWAIVIGNLELHRTAGIAWKNLSTYFFKDEENRCSCNRLYKYLYNSYQSNIIKNKEQIDLTKKICNILEAENISYALLKGISIIFNIYKDLGIREFNDNDFLVNRKDLSKMSSILEEIDYIQGESKHVSKIKRVSRKEKILRSTQSHEIMPYIKNLNDKNINAQHIVDIHFSTNIMSSNHNDSVVQNWLNVPLNFQVDTSTSIRTLKNENMFLFLCEHFFKEATSFYDFKKSKNLLLYKICDIYYFLRNHRFNWEYIEINAIKLGYDKALYFTLLYIKDIFNHDVFVTLTSEFKFENYDFIDNLYDFSDVCCLSYIKSVPLKDRFFN